MIKAYMNWSGGKDSAFCLHEVLQKKEYQVACLLTSMNNAYDRVSIHGVRRSLLEAQASSTGIPLQTFELSENPGMQEYEQRMQQKIIELKKQGCTHAIFGDIFLEDIRAYRENNLEQSNIKAVFPIWKKNTSLLAKEFIEAGFKAIVVCVNERYLDKSFCGRLLDDSFFNDLPSGVDPCGENGEYHSFVFDGPIFTAPVKFIKGELVYRKYDAPQIKDEASPSSYGFYFYDLLPDNDPGPV